MNIMYMFAIFPKMWKCLYCTLLRYCNVWQPMMFCRYNNSAWHHIIGTFKWCVVYTLICIYWIHFYFNEIQAFCVFLSSLAVSLVESLKWWQYAFIIFILWTNSNYIDPLFQLKFKHSQTVFQLTDVCYVKIVRFDKKNEKRNSNSNPISWVIKIKKWREKKMNNQFSAFVH